MINVGLIGYGYWGPNLARNFGELRPRARLTTIADQRPDRRELAQNRFPGVRVVADHRDILTNPAIDAVLIATPPSTHFALASEALASGKHVLVEKPLTETTEQAGRLIELAHQAARVLLVDHPFIYTGAVQKIKQLVDAGTLGQVLYLDSVRINLGLFQSDVNVIHDLAVHDIAIFDYLLRRDPISVMATGACHTATGVENIAYITLDYDDSILAHIHVNWLAPVKIRTMIIGGTKNMVIYDDVEPSEKVKVYDRGVNLLEAMNMDVERSYKVWTEYRIGDMYAPRLDQTEALAVEARHFLDCIEKGVQPLTDGESGRRVVRILEAAGRSLREGIPVRLQPARSGGA